MRRTKRPLGHEHGAASEASGHRVEKAREIDGSIGMYSSIFNNPFLIWGRYRNEFFKTRLTVSFQFHHTQMDGAHAAGSLVKLQDVINSLELRNPECRLKRPR